MNKIRSEKTSGVARSAANAGGLRLAGPAICIILIFAAGLICAAGCTTEKPEVRFAALTKKAADFSKQGKWEEARLSLLSAIDLMPKSDSAHYELAEVQLKLKQIAQAIENYRSTLNINPGHREARLHLAALMMAMRQYEAAESDINKLIEKNPKDIDARILKANLEATTLRKNYTEAKRLLNEVIAENPDQTAAIASLADISLIEGDAKQAEELFSKALSLDPKSPAIRMALADLYSRQGRLDEAQQALEALVTNNPDNSTVRVLLGEFLLGRGQAGKAIEQYEETLKVEPLRYDARDRLYDMYLTRKGVSVESVGKAKALTADLTKISKAEDAGVRYFQGRDLELDGKYPEALSKYLKTIELLNNFAPAFRRAGLVELLLGKNQEAIEHLIQAVALSPNDVVSRLALARQYFSKNDLSHAQEQADKILQIYPRQLGANVLRADIALLQNDTKSARVIYEALVKAFPENPVGFYKLALLEEKEGNAVPAMDAYRRCLSFDVNVLFPARRLSRLIVVTAGFDKAIAGLQELADKSQNQKPEYSTVIASLLLGKKNASVDDVERARKLLESAINERPTLYDAYFGLAQIDSDKNDVTSAKANYEKLVHLKPDNITYRMLLALTYEKEQQFEKAAEQYREILRQKPRFGPASNNLAWLMVDRLNGNLDEALKLAQAAKEDLPNVSSVTDTLGWIYFLQGAPRQALPILQDAADLERQANDDRKVNPEILYHLAEARFASGDKAGASSAIEEALANGGRDIPKYDKIQSLQQKIAASN